jgi:hypothetical protein
MSSDDEFSPGKICSSRDTGSSHRHRAPPEFCKSSINVAPCVGRRFKVEASTAKIKPFFSVLQPFLPSQCAEQGRC